MMHDEQEKHLQDLNEIRSLMERSSRFISLSGLSGVFVGLFALIGAAAAWYYTSDYPFSARVGYDGTIKTVTFLVADALLVLAASLLTAFGLTARRAKKQGQKLWDASARRLLINMLIPLAAGGILALILLFQYGLTGIIPSITLLFYGLALVNASKYTLEDIRYLGICEISLGLIAALFPHYGLLFWALGFGILHIVYGAVMYRKYER